MAGKEFHATRRKVSKRGERGGLKPRIKAASWKVNSPAQWALGTLKMVLGQKSDSGKWVERGREKGILRIEFTASQLREISSSFIAQPCEDLLFSSYVIVSSITSAMRNSSIHKVSWTGARTYSSGSMKYICISEDDIKSNRALMSRGALEDRLQVPDLISTDDWTVLTRINLSLLARISIKRGCNYESIMYTN